MQRLFQRALAAPSASRPGLVTYDLFPKHALNASRYSAPAAAVRRAVQSSSNKTLKTSHNIPPPNSQSHQLVPTR